MKLLSTLVKRIKGLKPARKVTRPKPTKRPSLEYLEDRCVPAALYEWPTLPTATAQPMGITSAYDGSVWFTESYANKLGRLNPATGALTEYAIPTASSSPRAITASPDGWVWFAEYNGRKIGRISQSGGAIAEFTLPGYGERPTALTVHPTTGVVWFASVDSSGTSRIGNISASGVITKLAAGQTSASFTGMTFTSDGYLWLTRVSSYWGDAISRVNTAGSGSYTHYKTPAYASPQSIAVGSDGNLWFTQYSSNQIGRLNRALLSDGVTSNDFTHFALPANSKPRSIVSGPDGALWFTCQTSNKIGRMTTAGVYSELAIATASSQPYGLTVGRGAYSGSLFFTEYTGNKIGQVVV